MTINHPTPTIAQDPYRVLFLCTGNSARSILAEALLNQLGQGRFQAFSAGSRPTGQVNPHALALLNELGLSTEGLHSKNWGIFHGPQATAFDAVITVCDNAARETCPTWHGQPLTLHWSLPDPAAVTGDAQRIQHAFRATAQALRARIERFISQEAHRLEQRRLAAPVPVD